MPQELVMPRLGSSMEEGVITTWLKQEGEYIEEGEPLLKVETDKAVLEVEAHYSGELHQIMVEEGESAPVGEPIALLLQEGEAPPPPTQSGSTQKKETVTEQTGEEQADSSGQALQGKGVDHEQENIDSNRIFASPVARRLARENNLNLENIEGSGPRGRIIKDDVELYLQKTAGDRGQITEIKVSGTRKRIARKTQTSMQQIPHYYVTKEIFVDDLLDIYEKIKENGYNEVSLNDFFIKGIALALDEFPRLNSSYNEDKGVIREYSNKNVGTVVARDRGVVIPVVKNANKKSLLEISRTTNKYLQRIKEEDIPGEMVEGGTFTISNMGMFGVSEFTGVIYPPQTAILAIGGIKQQLVAEDGEIESRNFVKFTLSLDHRVIDGVAGAEFLKYCQHLFARPSSLLME